ncbi:MAG: SDR family NAD(P)-dependent oxidoreductase [Polyangiales bacterium]|nr:SDR family NAD(P)-dependent oxidoreductase [Myxococcales bacterium]MCB9656600.1 SDR family NAD(P)-dependent oxidoreductase [Sandaracinaceae bacterium]
MSQRKVIIITGANSGIGKAMAMELGAAGHHVVMGCRSLGRGEAAQADIKAVATGPVDLLQVDVGSPDSVRAFAEQVRATYPKVDVLMNNAGVYLPKRQLTPEGFESMFAINHLGPFLLSHLLLEPLAGGRVVTTSSIGHRFTGFSMDNLQAERSFSAFRQYGLTKLANILFTREFDARARSRGIVANCFHPGAVGTEFAQDDASSLLGFGTKIGRVFLRTPKKGGETGVFLATDPAGVTTHGQYWSDKKVRSTSRNVNDENARALFEHSAALLGMEDLALPPI